MNRLALFVLLILGGCSTYSSQFDCPYGTGVGCASLSKVNGMVDRCQIDLGEEGGTPVKKKEIHIFYGPSQMSKLIPVQEPIID